MPENFIITRRGVSLYTIETALTSLILAIWLCRKYHWDWIIGVLLFFGVSFLIGILFFRVRLFRYIMSILFSLFWALLAYSFATAATKSTVSPLLAAGVIFVIGILSHKRYFRFESTANRVEYQNR
jgi:ABC-type polysaccharide/polyol phosphate export permease